MKSEMVMSDARTWKSAGLPLAMAALTALALAGCNDSSDDDGSADAGKPARPTGVGAELVVEVPEVYYPLPSVEYAENNADGTLRYIIGDNPVSYLLGGINDIWKGTSDSWQSGANGDGPDSYLSDPIVDAQTWQENIQYVIDVTNNRTDEEAILAFLDDRRSKNYSIIDGYGPLTEAYVAGSGAYTDIAVPTTAQVLSDVNYAPDSNDNIVFAGDTTGTLGEIVSLVDAFRQRSPASTSASKYTFSTPRPWRMDDDGAIDFLGTDQNYSCIDSSGSETIYTYDTYTTSVAVVPGLMCARRAHDPAKETDGLYTSTTENRRKDGGYPSGHTNAGYLASMALAYALPQRFSEMLTRASQLGEDRIVAGMHSPVDVIGGRIHSMIVASYALNQADIAAEADAAYQRAQSYFGDLAAAEDMTLYEYAHREVTDEAGLIDGSNVNIEVYDNNLYDDHEANKEAYRFRMTYGMTQDASLAGQAPIVPEGAEALLKSRQPYLTDAQRRAVLYTTSIDSGYPILDDTHGWGRLDLVTAADGYGAFEGDVAVTMDASLGGFAVHDWWRNDITGEGMLTKAGTGQLTLTGDNRYSGGTLLQGGILEATSTSALGAGDLYVDDGTARVDAEGALAIDGSFTMDGGELALVMDEDASQVSVAKRVYIDGGDLTLDFSGYAPAAGTALTLVEGASLQGTFGSVDAGDVTVELSYTDSSVIATVQ